MRRSPCLLLIGLAGCATGGVGSGGPAQRDPLAALVGREHPPRDSTVVEQSSFLLDESDRGRWVLAELVGTGTRSRGLVLEEVITTGPPAAARWRTVAVQRLRASDSLAVVQLGTCSREGRLDRAIVGIGATSTLPAVRRAWRADTIARRFVSIDARTVSCKDVTGT